MFFGVLWWVTIDTSLARSAIIAIALSSLLVPLSFLCSTGVFACVFAVLRTFQFLPGSQTALTTVSRHRNLIFLPYLCSVLPFSLPKRRLTFCGVLSHSIIGANPSVLPAPERDSHIPAWRLLDCRNGVFRLDSDAKGARDLRHAMWEATMPEELFGATLRWVQVLIHVEYLPTSSLVSWQTVVARHSASPAHHVLFKKVSSRRIRWGMGPLHGATVELGRQPWLLTLPIVVAAAAFALSANAVYSWRKESGVGRQTLEMYVWQGGGDVSGRCRWFVDAQWSWLLQVVAAAVWWTTVSTPPVVTVLVYFWKSHITHFRLAKSIVDDTCIFD